MNQKNQQIAATFEKPPPTTEMTEPGPSKSSTSAPLAHHKIAKNLQAFCVQVLETSHMVIHVVATKKQVILLSLASIPLPASSHLKRAQSLPAESPGYPTRATGAGRDGTARSRDGQQRYAFQTQSLTPAIRDDRIMQRSGRLRQ
ncbi:hypothetical protein POX_d05662 [Penicillium oxalicum]|uniref:hypothetical protein n=1 Tax=Penicillium oxalicum TaxID=69781 RepID=UPI0020B71B5E|nr:hypothetical protein POX_d05662 [Penicillium oxalicum]KAI2790156.1 hypothetical protein POX_d05662 [Penicillium oxalicum]